VTDDAKPELHLLPGDLAFDVDALVALFTQLTGRVPSAQEIAEARALIDAAQQAPPD
jgi:hypothetical protein